MSPLRLKDIALAGMIAAVYAVVALALAPISFGVYQVRVSEALTVLPFLTPAAIPGLYFGCMIANVFGGMGWVDIVFGSLITLAAGFATRGIYRLSQVRSCKTLALLPVALLWAASLILLMQHGLDIIVVGWLGLSAFGAVAGARLAATYAARPAWISVIMVSFFFVVLALVLCRTRLDDKVFVIGALALTAAWLITVLTAYVWIKGRNPAVIAAPLPPVLFNAFGVSAYLAPIMGSDYWFTVQMVGVGQLISCYLLGLPLLLILEKRKSLFL
jgi:uncharacterized membrane protein